MFRNVPECSGMFHVPGFIDALKCTEVTQPVRTYHMFLNHLHKVHLDEYDGIRHTFFYEV